MTLEEFLTLFKHHSDVMNYETEREFFEADQRVMDILAPFGLTTVTCDEYDCIAIAPKGDE